jgi:O-antigen ligase
LLPLQNVIERMRDFPLGKDFVDVLLIALVMGWVIRCMVKKEKVFVRTPFNTVLLVMAIFTYISLWRGSSYLGFPAPLSVTDLRFQAWKNYMILPLLYLITVNNIKDVRQVKWLVVAMAVSIFLMEYRTANQVRLMQAVASRHKVDGTFVWTGVNVVAAFYADYIFVLLGIFMLHRATIVRAGFAFLILVASYIILFLFSRGAYAGVVAGCATISVIRKRILLVPLILLLVLWQTVLPSRVIERINQTQGEEGLDESSRDRLELWRQSVDMFEGDPLMGVGFGVMASSDMTGGYRDAHNIYMEVLGEQGIIGLAILLTLFALALRAGWWLYTAATDTFLKGLGLGFIACVVATMVTNVFGDRWTYLQLMAYYWVFLALVVRGHMISVGTAISPSEAHNSTCAGVSPAGD